jgi:toxin ParE1/3/4
VVQVNWTPEAVEWLRRIYDYLSPENLRIAEKVILEIIQKADLLEHNPRLGSRLDQWSEYEIRMMVYGNYRIVYRNVSEAQIDVLGVFHGAMDLAKYLDL